MPSSAMVPGSGTNGDGFRGGSVPENSTKKFSFPAMLSPSRLPREG